MTNSGAEPTAETPPAPKRKSLLFRLRLRLHLWWPTRFTDPSLRDEIEFWRERDADMNAKTIPPSDETIQFHCLWVIEMYVPSHLAALIEGMRKLGWNLDPSGVASDRSPVVWLERARSRSLGGSWMNLSTIVRQDDKRFLGDKWRAPLPDGIDRARGALISLTPSITCFVVQFIMDEHAGQKPEELLRENLSTTTERYGRGYTILSPDFQKEGNTRAARVDLRRSCENWFASLVPGAFSSGLLGGRAPCCEFWTLEQERPFPQREEGMRPPEYLRLLGFDDDIDAWAGDDLPGFRLGSSTFPLRDDMEHLLVLAGKTSEIPGEETLESYGGANRWGYTNWLTHRIEPTLSRWGLDRLLLGYERGLAHLRHAGLPEGVSARDVESVLATIRSDLRGSADVSAVCSDLLALTEGEWQFDYGVADFKPVNTEVWKEPKPLSERLRSTISTRARVLQENERALRELLLAYGSTQAARTNVTLQRRLLSLSWFLAILTVATLTVAIATLLRSR